MLAQSAECLTRAAASAVSLLLHPPLSSLLSYCLPALHAALICEDTVVPAAAGCCDRLPPICRQLRCLSLGLITRLLLSSSTGHDRERRVTRKVNGNVFSH